MTTTVKDKTFGKQQRCPIHLRENKTLVYEYPCNNKWCRHDYWQYQPEPIICQQSSTRPLPCNDASRFIVRRTAAFSVFLLAASVKQPVGKRQIEKTTDKPTTSQLFCQPKVAIKNTTSVGKIISPRGRPLVATLTALPRLIENSLAIVVIAACGRRLCPKNLSINRLTIKPERLLTCHSIRLAANNPKAPKVTNQRSPILSTAAPSHMRRRPLANVAIE